jgi:hypothetical protein
MSNCCPASRYCGTRAISAMQMHWRATTTPLARAVVEIMPGRAVPGDDIRLEPRYRGRRPSCATPRARVHELAVSVQHVLDLPPKIGGNIITGLLKPQLDYPTRMLSILGSGGWINGKCGQCLERIESVPPGERSEIVVVHCAAVPLSAARSVPDVPRHCDDSTRRRPAAIAFRARLACHSGDQRKLASSALGGLFRGRAKPIVRPRRQASSTLRRTRATKPC